LAIKYPIIIYDKKEAKANAVLDFNAFIGKETYIVDDKIDLDALEKVNFSIDNNNK
jgi:hypothetical protein